MAAILEYGCHGSLGQKYQRAQYLDLFYKYKSTSVPSLVLLDKTEQLFHYAAGQWLNKLFFLPKIVAS